MLEDIIEQEIEESREESVECPKTEIKSEVSFHAIASMTHPQTMWVLGRLKNKEVMVLIDGGSTHNFIDRVVVTKFGLHVEHNKTIQVTVTNQEKIECNGLCRSFTIMIQGQAITADYYILPVAACSVVLGV